MPLPNELLRQKQVDITLTGSNQVGVPTDGDFGSTGGVSGIDSTDLIADAFDKVELTFEKLLPPKPKNLSAVQLIIPNLWTAKVLNSNTVINTGITTVTQPIATISEEFYNADAGVLTFNVNSVANGTKTLTTGTDTGIYSGLTITAEQYYPINTLFWKSLLASVQSTSALTPASTQHSYELVHSLTGSSIKTFYIDNPVAVSIPSRTVTIPGSGLIVKYVSGVPSYNTGSPINVAMTVGNGASYFWNLTRVGRVENAAFIVAKNLNPSSPPTTTTVSITDSTTIGTGYTETLDVIFTGYNARFGQITSIGSDSLASTLTTAIRVDTNTVETDRKTSGIGQYPTTGYGSVFNSATSLATGGNEELQKVNSTYIYPSLNYSSKLPIGPNYTGLTGSYSTYRWVTFSLGVKSSINAVKFTINNQVNFGSLTIITGCLIYVKVEGQTGWINANLEYNSSPANPSADGDAALDMSASTVSTRRATFGTTTRSGEVFVRIGLPSSSTKTFSGITEITPA